MIRLYIHDKCFEQMFKLPKATQKKVVEFQKKFRENSKSSAIHLEPIQDFKDSTLQTARIDQKYRAVIKVPESGSDFYMLWVDNHDEAYEWARSKTFLWNGHTGAAQIFSVPEAMPASQIENSRQSNGILFASYPDEKLLAIGVPEPCLPMVRSVNSLNDLGAIEAQLPSDAFENLFYLSDGASIETLIGEIKEGAANDPESLNNRRSFVRVDDSLLEEWLNGSIEKWQLFLHSTQRKLVEKSFSGPVKLTGGGGTGKTVVALHRLQKLAQSGTTTKPILFTTYTLSLTHNLETLVARMHIQPSFIKLINIDKLAIEHASQLNIIQKSTRILDFQGSRKAVEIWDKVLEDNLSSFDAEFLHQEYNEVWLHHNIKDAQEYFRTSRIGRGRTLTRKQKMEVASLFEAYEKMKNEQHYLDRYELFNKLTDHYLTKENKPYSHVIADEIQDFSNAELRFLRALVEEKANDLFLVGDPYQKIYARKINFSRAGINVRGNRSKRLRINYRTTEEIKRLAISTVRGFDYDDFDGASESMDGYLSLMHGDRPTYQVFKTRAEELSYILGTLKQLLNGEVAQNSIVIASRTKESIREIKTLLHQNKLSYYDLTDKTGDIKGIHLSTFHGLKGLEYKAVFLNNVNSLTAPQQLSSWSNMTPEEREEYIMQEKALLYVAMTRAINNLYISGIGTKSDLINLM